MSQLAAHGQKVSFPPLVTRWTVKSEPNWPGAEYTRRTRLKTECEGTYSAAFMAELEATLGAVNFQQYMEAMRPTVKPRARGTPPPTAPPAAACRIPPPYVLRRAEGEVEDLGATSASAGQRALGTLRSSTRSLTGTMSQSRVLDVAHTTYGPTPSYMFEDREQARPVPRPRLRWTHTPDPPPSSFAWQMSSMDEWFVKYGRPTHGLSDDAALSGRKYTHYKPINRRCCGAPSVQQKMVRGGVTK